MEERMDARLRERLRQIQQPGKEEGKPRPPVGKLLLLLLLLGGLTYGVWTVFSVKRGPTIYLQIRTSPPVKDTLLFVQLRAYNPESAPERSDLTVEVYEPSKTQEKIPQGHPSWRGWMGKPVKLPPGLFGVYFASNPTVPVARIPLPPALDGQVVDTLVEVCLVDVILPSEAQMFYEKHSVTCKTNPCPFPREGVLRILRNGQQPYMVQVNGSVQKSVVDLRRCEDRMKILFPGQERASRETEVSPQTRKGGGSLSSPRRGPSRPRTPSLTRVLNTGDVAGLARLLDEGVISLKYRDKNGLSLLHLAAVANQSELIRFLVQEGLPVDIRDPKGNTPLHYAAFYGKLQAVKTLLSLGADLNARNVHRGETPLFSAIRGRQTAVVRYLLQRGARVDLRNAYGLTPIHVVACCAMGATDILDLLVQAGADPRARTGKALRNVPAGATALDVAEAFGNTLVAQALSRYGVRRGAYGGTP